MQERPPHTVTSVSLVAQAFGHETELLLGRSLYVQLAALVSYISCAMSMWEWKSSALQHQTKDWCLQGLLGDAKMFKMEFEKRITAGNDKHATGRDRQIAAAKAAELRARIAPFFLRREKKDVLPQTDRQTLAAKHCTTRWCVEALYCLGEKRSDSIALKHNRHHNDCCQKHAMTDRTCHNACNQGVSVTRLLQIRHPFDMCRCAVLSRTPQM